MKLRGNSFNVFLRLFMIMTLTVWLSGCSSSKPGPSPNTSTKENQTTAESKEQTSKAEPSATETQKPPVKTEPAAVINYDKLLTTADVEQVSGLKGVKLIPYNPQIGAGGKLNFAIEGDKPILAVMIEDESIFSMWKKDKNLNAATVPNLADEAFKGVADNPMYTPNVTFIKGGKAIQLFTFFNLDNNMKPYMNHEQLIKLAKIIEGRM